MRPAETLLGQPVRSLQTMLRVLAEFDTDYLPLIPDGIYGAETMAAVTRFQRKHGLPATGITDQATWDAVVLAYEPALVDRTGAQLLEVMLQPGEVIRRGSEHPHLFVVQGMLENLSRQYGSVGKPGMTGKLDAATFDALSTFQHLSGLPMTGNLDKMTWKHLALQYPLAVDLQQRKPKGTKA